MIQYQTTIIQKWSVKGKPPDTPIPDEVKLLLLDYGEITAIKHQENKDDAVILNKVYGGVEYVGIVHFMRVQK